MRIYTIGHSNRTFESLVHDLGVNAISLLVDVRSHPGSKNNPQFNLEEFKQRMGTRYIWLPTLGGPDSGEYSNPLVFPKHRIGRLRPEFKGIDEKDRPVTWWNTGLRDYDEWMGTSPNFMLGIRDLRDLAAQNDVAIMCAEALWWKCHRSMIADAWEVAGGEVLHIMSGKPRRHTIGNRLDRYTSATRAVMAQLKEQLNVGV